MGDCVKAVEEYVKEGRKFDYVFGDLTDVPISESPTGELWDFINKILRLSFKILKPTGKFMTHVSYLHDDLLDDVAAYTICQNTITGRWRH